MSRQQIEEARSHLSFLRDELAAQRKLLATVTDHQRQQPIHRYIGKLKAHIAEWRLKAGDG